MARYHRQTLLQQIGDEGQRRLGEGTVLIVGCSALGSTIAETLARAGVGTLRIVDRDLVELTNLQRQTLFDETDAQEAIPKAAAAERRLLRVNSQITVEPVVADYNPSNAERLARGCDVLVDGTDNFETRFLLNDVAVKRGLPYVYGGAIATRGMVYPVLPRGQDRDGPWDRAGVAGPCLRCIFEDAPSAGGETCDTVGVISTVAAIVAQTQATEAMKLLVGDVAAVRRSMLTIDVWAGRIREVDVTGADEPDRCACCGQRRFEFLEGSRTTGAAALCGRNAVQVRASRSVAENGRLAAIADRLRSHGPVQHTEHLIRAELRDNGCAYQLTLFPDGRAIVHGTADPSTAKTLYSRYVGL